MNELDKIKDMMKEAVAEGRDMVMGECNVRGILWWKKSHHEWNKWRVKLQRITAAGKPEESVHGYFYVRSCKHCGVEEFRYERIA